MPGMALMPARSVGWTFPHQISFQRRPTETLQARTEHDPDDRLWPEVPAADSVAPSFQLIFQSVFG